MHAFSGLPGRRCLRGMLLGLPQLGHGGGQSDQIRDQRDRCKRAVPGDLASQRDQAGGTAEPVTVTRAPG
jgi:hypothetical protein